jgi:hypothetical protein
MEFFGLANPGNLHSKTALFNVSFKKSKIILQAPENVNFNTAYYKPNNFRKMINDIHGILNKKKNLGFRK